MSKSKRFVQLFILLLGFIFGGCGVGVARADFIPAMFTGSWKLFCLESDGCVASKQQQSLLPYMQFALGPEATGLFSFSGSISGYSDDGGCNPPTLGCIENWGGSFSGGSVSFAAYDPFGDVSFTGMITGGSFSGIDDCPFLFEDGFLACGSSEEASFAFVSPVWGKGWRSVGTFHFFSDRGPEPDMFGTSGTLTMTTTTVPEPSSMALLGSGIVAIASFVRCRKAIVKR